MSTDKQTEVIIAQYEIHPELWDKTNVHYANRVKKKRAIRNIGKAVGLSPTEVESKIRNIRTVFLRQLKEVETSQKSGSGGNDEVEPRYRWFKQLLFLKPGTAYSGKCTTSINCIEVRLFIITKLT